MLYQIGGKLLECIIERFIDEIMDRIASFFDSDISTQTGNNISLLIKHISNFELLKKK